MDQEQPQNKSNVDGYTNAELKEILVGNTEAFLNRKELGEQPTQKSQGNEQEISECASIFTEEDGSKFLEISFGKKLFSAQVGQMGLSRDIEKSLKDPREGIRDFFTTNYDDQSRLNIHDKEKYLNLPQTGEPAKALAQLSKYDNQNKYNTADIGHLNDATFTSMKRIHYTERAENPGDTTLTQRQATEVALWNLRESEQLGSPAQELKEKFREVLISHVNFKEAQTGKQLAEKSRPGINKEFEKFEMNESLKVRLSGPKMKM